MIDTPDIDLDAPAMTRLEALMIAYRKVDFLYSLGATSLPDAKDRADLGEARKNLGLVLGIQQ